MPYQAYENNTAFLDLMFNTLLGFAFLFFISFFLINPQQKQADIKTKAEFVINVTWPDDSKDDVDTWLQDPLGNIIYFRQKENGLMHLDRDDLGHINDVIVLPDGRVIKYSHNQELTTIRGFIAGEWVLNVHMYMKRDFKNTTVEVSVDKLNPRIQKYFYKKLILTKQWQEVTVTRFRMTETGKILDWDDLPKKLNFNTQNETS